MGSRAPTPPTLIRGAEKLTERAPSNPGRASLPAVSSERYISPMNAVNRGRPVLVGLLAGLIVGVCVGVGWSVILLVLLQLVVVPGGAMLGAAIGGFTGVIVAATVGLDRGTSTSAAFAFVGVALLGALSVGLAVVADPFWLLLLGFGIVPCFVAGGFSRRAIRWVQRALNVPLADPEPLALDRSASTRACPRN